MTWLPSMSADAIWSEEHIEAKRRATAERKYNTGQKHVLMTHRDFLTGGIVIFTDVF